MDALTRYRKRVLGNPETAKAPFIEKALNKITIHEYKGGEVLEKAMDAVLIFRDREGPDTARLYTYASDGLNVGDRFVKKGVREENDVYFLILEEVKRVDTSEKIRVFNTLETNVNVSKNAELMPAYFLSNLKNRVREPGRDGVELEVKEAVLIAPINYRLKLDEILNISSLTTGHQPEVSWQVYGIDDLSSPTIAYHHLTQVFKKSEEVELFSVVETDGLGRIGDVIKVATEDGYIKTTPAARVITRERDFVEVQLPSGTDMLAVTVKENGEVVELFYEVRP